MTPRELYEELDRLCEAVGDVGHSRSVLDSLVMAREAARRAVKQSECPHPPGRSHQTPLAGGSILIVCRACGRQAVEAAPKP